MVWRDRPTLIRHAFEVVERVGAATDRAASSTELVAGLAALISCDLVAENTVQMATGNMAPSFHPQSPWERPADHLAPHVRRHPLISHFARTGDSEARRVSDVCSEHTWLHGPVYRHVFAQHGLRYVLGYGSRTPDGTVEGVALCRTTADFTEEERHLVSVLAPRLLALRRQFAQPEALTERERQIGGLFASGLPSSGIAAYLGISARTVDKHLEHIYRKLGVQSAGAAVAALNGRLPVASQ